MNNAVMPAHAHAVGGPTPSEQLVLGLGTHGRMCGYVRIKSTLHLVHVAIGISLVTLGCV
jgi:hypothetical protein